MRWHKITKYSTSLEFNDEQFNVVAIKEGSDDFFAIQVNGDYLGDSEEIPTHEYITQLIAREQGIEHLIDEANFLSRLQ